MGLCKTFLDEISYNRYDCMYNELGEEDKIKVDEEVDKILMEVEENGD